MPRIRMFTLHRRPCHNERCRMAGRPEYCGYCMECFGSLEEGG